jgi:hypothetical protein
MIGIVESSMIDPQLVKQRGVQIGHALPAQKLSILCSTPSSCIIKGRPFWSRVLSVGLNPFRKDTLL